MITMLNLMVLVKLQMMLCLLMVHDSLSAFGPKPPLFDPNLYTWKDSNFTLPPENYSLIIRYDVEKEKMEVLDWPSPRLNLQKGINFTGYFYFRSFTPVARASEILANHRQGRIITGLNQMDYCLAVDIEDDYLRQMPGYDGRRIAAACIVCLTKTCPKLKMPCDCGWFRFGVNHEMSHFEDHEMKFDMGTEYEKSDFDKDFSGISWWD